MIVYSMNEEEWVFNGEICIDYLTEKEGGESNEEINDNQTEKEIVSKGDLQYSIRIGHSNQGDFTDNYLLLSKI